MVGGELMARGMHFGKPRPGRIHGPFDFVFQPYSPEVLHCSRNGISVSSGKGLNFIALIMYLCYQNSMETTIGRIFIR